MVSIVSLTRWSPTDPAEVIDAASYTLVSRDPAGALIAPVPGQSFPEPLRPIGSFALTYTAGWTVTPETSLNSGDGVNLVPASVRFMIQRAVQFRSGAGLKGLSIGSLKLSVADAYSTDRLPAAIASIGRAWNFRPGIFASKPSSRLRGYNISAC